MPQSFSCPSCGAPLEYRGELTTIQCPYCFTSSTVPPELRSQSAAVVEPGVMLSFMAQATKLRELASLVRTGQKPAAVLLYQQIYQVDAATAIRAVNMLTGGGNVIVAGYDPSPTPTFTPPPATGVSTPASYSYTPPASSATYTITQTTPPTQRSNAGCVLAVVGAVFVGVVGCALAGVLMFASSDNSISGINGESPDATAQREMTQIAMASTEESQAQTQIARTPSATATLTPTASATATIDPGPALTVTAILIAQATQDAGLVATAQAWPVTYQENFDGTARGWDRYAAVDNDYYRGSVGVTGGVYRFDVSTKQDTVSLVWPDPYNPVGDFYASVDFTITGPADVAAGLTFYHSSDDQDLAYYVIDSDGNYLTNLIFGSSNISNSGAAAGPLSPGPNHLGLVALNGHLILLVNDQIIGTVDSIFNNPNQGDVGIVIYLPQGNEDAVIDFDNFVIRTPN